MHKTKHIKPLARSRSPQTAATPALAEQEALVALFTAGRFAEGETLARQLTQRYPDAAFSWKALGTLLLAGDRQREALPVLKRAVELAPYDAESINILGKTLQDLNQVEEALDCFNQALALRPDSAIVINDQANILKALHRPTEALTGYVRALAHHRRAIELKADFNGAKINYVNCLKRLHFQYDDPSVRQLLLQAITEGWCRPDELTNICNDFIKFNPIIRDAIQRSQHTWSAQSSLQQLLETTEIDAILNDTLFVQVMETIAICDVELEQLLTLLRYSMLLQTLTTNAATPAQLQLLQLIAIQCYLNEYVFAVTDDETAHLAELKQNLITAIEQQLPISALQVVTLAAYYPLDCLPTAMTLFERPSLTSLTAILIQHLREPQQQAEYRRHMPQLTPIESGISALVKNQYEENPYPRWVKTAAVTQSLTIDAFIRQQFPLVRFHPLRKQTNADILIAGCGTGLHSIDTALRFTDSQVLAIDFSLASLSYAQRKTAELGITNLRYAQADILQLNTLDLQFDLIESAGVLHHLEDPVLGWKILLEHLRPGRFMSLGLYSQCARRSVVKAQDFIAAQGYQATADDIRRCRQALINQSDIPEYQHLISGRDFHSLSGCRDLLFHVNEHHFTLPQIAKLLRELKLNFLGFIIDHAVINDYCNCFPDDPTATNLKYWDQFEQEHPDTFANMYQFWMQKAS
ncbi:class I SAM-dependent methyltransferase [Chromatium okenii]|uniref:class I SAM-dependent methyltransferase n=1 Tax=Chromatium okenii TaxID=61644 RepID=UPI0026F0E609|nr:class I SAM-dependent methyltransferase [Chromatium okenii]MBV5307997.1 methyltransferase domain-containing protein [Chromatium okenii]